MGLTGNSQDPRPDRPLLQSAGGHVGAMLSSGAPDAQILKFLNDSGIPADSTNVGQALKFRHTKDFQNWQKANPGKPYPIGPEFYTRQVPMSQARQNLNAASQSGPGGALQTGVLAGADALTGGRLDNMVPTRRWRKWASTQCVRLTRSHPSQETQLDN
jgi:hypothetical protein